MLAPQLEFFRTWQGENMITPLVSYSFLWFCNSLNQNICVTGRIQSPKRACHLSADSGVRKVISVLQRNSLLKVEMQFSSRCFLPFFSYDISKSLYCSSKLIKLRCSVKLVSWRALKGAQSVADFLSYFGDVQKYL